MIGPPHVLLIPDHITQKALQPPDGPALHVEGHGLDRLPLERAQLAHHIIEEMGARLTPGQTAVKGGRAFPEFLQNPSTSGGVRSKVGSAKPSLSVRQAGNIGGLLLAMGVYRSSIPWGHSHSKHRCRCRVRY